MWSLAADVGGTFTDLVLMDGSRGAIFLDKVPSTPGRANSVLQGIERITAQAGVAPRDVDLFVHGFTVGTNAFLMRSGARVALVVTRGFRDVLEIGNQLRPSLYHLSQRKPTPVVRRSCVVEAQERVDAFGEVLMALSDAEAVRVADAVAALAPEAVAVCLTFAHLAPQHEQRLAKALEARLPGVPVYLSCRVNPQIEEYPRANTTAVAAYVGPVVARYVTTLEQALNALEFRAPLRLMRSDGGVATPASARENPVNMLLSGPAGGVIAGAAVAAELDVPDIVTFDMGGTSADFSLIVAGEPRMVTARVVDGQPLRMPTLDIETISAGGGSIAHVDLGGALRVGPHSAGAEPGPACYGLGGQDATVTDAAVVLGIIHPQEFLGGEMRIDAQLALEAVSRAVADPLGLDVYAAALGIVRIANASMARAIRKLLVERGLDLRDFALLAFGGAGPVYAPYLAQELGMREVLVPDSPGVYAARGLLMSDIRHVAQAPCLRRLDALDAAELAERCAQLRATLEPALARDGIPPADRYYRYSADMRCIGQFHELAVPLPAPASNEWWSVARAAADFHAEHARAYGHADSSVPVEVVNLRLEAFGRMARATAKANASTADGPPVPITRRPVCLAPDVGFVPTDIYRRADLAPGHEITGPAIVTQRDTTTVVLAGQRARVASSGTLRIEVRS